MQYKQFQKYYLRPEEFETFEFDSWLFKETGIKSKEDFLLNYWNKKSMISKARFYNKIGKEHKHLTDKYAEYWQTDGFIFRTLWGGGSILRSYVEIFYSAECNGVFTIPHFEKSCGLSFNKVRFENITERKAKSIAKLLKSIDFADVSKLSWELFKTELNKATKNITFQTIN